MDLPGVAVILSRRNNGADQNAMADGRHFCSHATLEGFSMRGLICVWTRY